MSKYDKQPPQEPTPNQPLDFVLFGEMREARKSGRFFAAKLISFPPEARVIKFPGFDGTDLTMEELIAEERADQAAAETMAATEEPTPDNVIDLDEERWNRSGS